MAPNSAGYAGTQFAERLPTKNREGERAPEMHQPEKGNQYHFGMKAHIGFDAESGVVQTT